MSTEQLAAAIRDAFASGVSEASIHGQLKRLGYTDRQIHEATMVANHTVLTKSKS